MLEEDKLRIGSKIRLIKDHPFKSWRLTVGGIYEITNVIMDHPEKVYYFSDDKNNHPWFTMRSKAIEYFEHVSEKNNINFLDLLKVY
jgi:hypothetical protein